jgi:hypothetical protein
MTAPSISKHNVHVHAALIVHGFEQSLSTSRMRTLISETVVTAPSVRLYLLRLSFWYSPFLLFWCTWITINIHCFFGIRDA